MAIIFVVLMPSGLNAQTISIHHPLLRFVYEDSLIRLPSFHSALQPFRISKDMLLSGNGTASRKIFVSPVIDASAGVLTKNHFAYRFSQGGYISANLGKKAGFELSAYLTQEKFPGESYSIDSLKLVPRHNRYYWGKGEQAVYPVIRGNVWWKANRWLTFTAGNDKNFFGDGERSVLLSENAAAYPYFQTRLNIWKVNYIHQVMLMNDLVSRAKEKRFVKYASMHVLSLNATKRLNFYVFEAVVWRKQDSVRHRGFDIHYLNPFLFYRPVEFNMGSPDNVFMGLGGKYLVGKHAMIYSQFMLDEFKLKEIKAQNGWWATSMLFRQGPLSPAMNNVTVLPWNIFIEKLWAGELIS